MSLPSGALPVRIILKNASALHVPIPYWTSGEMFGEYSVPNGVSMARPPPNVLPRGAVWHATQSPARARYSPRITISGRVSGAFAAVPAAVFAVVFAVAFAAAVLRAASAAWAFATNGVGASAAMHARAAMPRTLRATKFRVFRVMAGRVANDRLARFINPAG